MHADYMLCIEGWLGCLVVSWMLVIFRFYMVVQGGARVGV